MRSIEEYQKDYFIPKDRQKANAQRGRLLDRLTREKMSTVIYQIVQILNKAPAEDWFQQIRHQISKLNENELKEIASQFKTMLVNVGTISDKYVLKDNILDLFSGGLEIPRAQIKGERGRPPLAI